MAVDHSLVVSRLDTISFLFAIMTLAPLAATRRGTAIIIYGILNIFLLIAFAYIFEVQFNISHSQLVDYIADNSLSFVFLSVTSFSSFAINRRALNRAEEELAERRKAENALTESEERYRMLFETSREAIVILEAPPSLKHIAINRAAHEMFRLDISNMPPAGAGLLGLAPELQPDGESSRDKTERMVQKALTDGWAFFEFINRRMNGEEFPSSVLLSTFQLQGKPYLQVSMRDITARKNAEEQIQKSLREKEVLLREIHHRVKNNFQVIISLLNLKSGGITDENLQNVFNESVNRIRAMALVHEGLYRTENISDIDFGSYIKKISEELYTSYASGPDRPELIVDSQDIYLGIDQAIPCGLILNELVTNALKYAFPASGSGHKIRVALRRSGNDAIIITISDNGIGMPEYVDPGSAQTLGLQLVSVLIKQIHGTYRIDRQNGTSWEIIIPSGLSHASG